jgi:glycosyltransferase involved in cell wall biosynthesis
MDWLPNEDAVLYFCREILPLIWQRNNKVKFYIVGKGPTKAIQSLGEKDARIVVTGRVDDVRPLMAKAKVFVVPIRVGGGTRLKILEAMSMKKAVVSTTLGAEGIKYSQGKDILIADQPQDFADHVVRLLKDQVAASNMGEAARSLVCRTYDWHIVGEKLNQIYHEVKYA